MVVACIVGLLVLLASAVRTAVIARPIRRPTEPVQVRQADSTSPRRMDRGDLEPSPPSFPQVTASRRLNEHPADRKADGHDDDVTDRTGLRVMHVDPADGNRVVKVNPSMCRLLGYTPSQLLGLAASAFTHQEDRQRVDALIRQALTKDPPASSGRCRLVHRDGRVIWVTVQATVVRASDQRATHIALTVTGASGRRNSVALVRGVFDHSPDAYIIVNAQTQSVLSVNHAACQLLRQDEDALVGRPVSDLFGDRDSPGATSTAAHETFAQHWSCARSRGAPVGFDLPIWARDRVIPIDVMIAPLTLDGEPDVTLVVARDLTDRAIFESELIAARDAAAAADRAKSEFLAAMSHEIRTPMNGVLGMLDLLAATTLSPEQSHMVATSKQSARTLLTVINDILDFSKIEAGHLELESIPMSVADLVDDVAGALGPECEERGNVLVLSCDPSLPPWVLGDPIRLRQVLYNIAGNAVKFTRGGRIRIRAAATIDADGQPLVAIDVEDSGIGMTAEQLDDLYSPFVQAERSITRRFGGTGLGLAIVRRLLDMMDGGIKVTSEAGKGSRFRILVPAVAAMAPDDAPPPVDLFGIRAIICTGDPELDVAARKHAESAGARVEVTSSAWQLLRRCQAMAEAGTPPDVVFLGSFVGEHRRHHVILDLVGSAATASIRRVATRKLTPDGPELPDTHLVNSSPLRRRDLLCGLAVAVGRASPDPDNLASSLLDTDWPAPTVEEAARAGTLVLVVDDNAVNRDVLRRQVSMLGHAAEVAVDGKDALECLSRRDYALVLCDVHMPGMDGYAFTREVRAREAGTARHQGIIAVTANAMQDEVARAFEAGMDGYLTKPLDMQALRSAVTAWVGQPHGRSIGGEAQLPAWTTSHGQPVIDTAAADAAVLDRNVLRGLFRGDGTQIQTLLDDFVLQQRASVEQLMKVVTSRRHEELRYWAHRVRSAASMVGANEMARLAAAVETAALERDWARAVEDAKQIPKAMNRFVAAAAAEQPTCELASLDHAEPRDPDRDQR